MSSVATLPAESRYSKLSYLTCVVLIWFHIQAVAAFWSFSWTNLFVAAFLYWVAIGLGISMGYHRLHTHRGFKTYRLFEYFLAVSIRTRRASTDSGRTSAGSCSARRTTTTPRRCRSTRPTSRRTRSTRG
jgi:fatty-acid desaturase